MEKPAPATPAPVDETTAPPPKKADTKQAAPDAKEAEKQESKAEVKPEDKKRPGLSGAFDAADGEKAEAKKLELKFPEGAAESFKAEATSLAEALGVDSAAGQKLVDALAERQAEAEAKWEAQLDAWHKALDGDDEVKKSGGVKRALSQASLAMRQVGSPELAKVLADTGFEHHPEVVRAFIRIGRLLGEDTVRGTLSGAAAAPKPESLGQLLYGRKS